MVSEGFGGWVWVCSEDFLLRGFGSGFLLGVVLRVFDLRIGRLIAGFASNVNNYFLLFLPSVRQLPDLRRVEALKG